METNKKDQDKFIMAMWKSIGFTDNNTGAYPKDTRVIKCNAEEGDRNPIGARAVVLCSKEVSPEQDAKIKEENPDIAHLPQVKFMYVVKFIATDEITGVIDYKIKPDEK